MEVRTNTLGGHAAFDVSFDGRTVDFAVSEAYTAEDGRVFVSGMMTDQSTLNESTFLIEVNDPDFANFADKGWKEQAALMDAKIEGILEAGAAGGRAAFTFLDSDDPSKIIESIQESLAPPAVAEVVEPEGPKPANLEAGEPIRIADHQTDGPSLFEGFSIGDQTGDLVVHDIEFVDNKPFLTGTFSVGTPTGSEVREFAVAINVDNFPNVEDLTVDDVQKLTSPELVQEMLDLKGHEIVLSVDEAFPDRARLLSDIDEIRTTPNLAGFQGDIPHLANLAQEYPDLVNTMDLYANSWSPFGRDENVLKLAVMDHVGVTDPALRASLVDATGDFADFHDRLSSKSIFFEASPGTRRVVSDMAENPQHLADVAKNFSGLSRSGRLLAGVTGVGTAMTAAAASASTYEGHVMAEMTEMQYAAGDLTKAAYDDLMAFHENTTNAQYTDAAAGAVDQLIIPSLLMTLSVESAAQENLNVIAARHGLSEEMYQMHARSMFGGHTASHEAVLEAIKEFPDSIEGQPEELHEAIELKERLEFLQRDLTTFRSPYLSVTVPEDIQDQIVAKERVIENVENALVAEVSGVMQDPETVEALLDTMSIHDRTEFVKALAIADEDLAAENPVLARALDDLPTDMRGPGAQIQAEIRAARNAVEADNGAALNEYIISRLMPEPETDVAPAIEGPEAETAIIAEVDLSEMGDFSIDGVAVGGDMEQLRSAAVAGLDIDPGHINIEDPAVSNAPVVAPTLS